jgi:nicotinate-nucleotide--dimethylbenzimidazole phosphoribosyltransferase
VTRQILAAAGAGQAMGVTAARSAGLDTRLVDAGVDGAPVEGVPRLSCLDPRGDLVTADAMSHRDTSRLLHAGRDLGMQAGRQGLVALGEVGVANTTVAAALACLLLDLDPDTAVGLGAAADTAILDRKRAVVHAALRRARRAHGLDLHESLVALAAVGGPEIAVLTGVVLGAAATGAAVMLDGLVTCLAAVIAVATEPATSAHLIAGHRSREQAHQAVLTELGCEPLLDLRIRAGEGVGACLAAATLRQALLIRQAAARVDY